MLSCKYKQTLTHTVLEPRGPYVVGTWRVRAREIRSKYRCLDMLTRDINACDSANILLPCVVLIERRNAVQGMNDGESASPHSHVLLQ